MSDYENMSKREFVIRYVFLRAGTASNGLNADDAAKSAVKAWDEVISKIRSE